MTNGGFSFHLLLRLQLKRLHHPWGCGKRGAGAEQRPRQGEERAPSPPLPALTLQLWLLKTSPTQGSERVHFNLEIAWK